MDLLRLLHQISPSSDRTRRQKTKSPQSGNGPKERLTLVAEPPFGPLRFEGRSDSLSQANKLSRTHAALLDALNRHRGKGQQKVTVEHVHVHSGGHAIVGNVNGPGGGDAAKLGKQSHAQQIGHAPEPPMPSPDPTREPVPVAGDAERAVPDARRGVAGSAEG